jgi:hypothetical protein
MSFIDPKRFGDVESLEERYKNLNAELIEEIHDVRFCISLHIGEETA